MNKFQDADSLPATQSKKKISVISPNMDIKSVQLPQATVKPNQRRRYSLTKSNLKDKVMSVTLLSSLQTVSMSRSTHEHSAHGNFAHDVML